MIIQAGILIALLANDGHWFGGSTQTVAFEWAVLGGAPEVRIDWELSAGRVVVAKGQVELQGSAGERGHGDAGAVDRAEAKVPLPRVRLATEMIFHYRAVQRTSERIIEEGRSTVHVYPRDLVASSADRLRGREIYVWDDPAGLPALLQRAKVPRTSFDDPRKLQFVRPDILVVAAGQVGRHPEGQAKLLDLAAAGTGVLIMRQADLASLGGFRLVPRKVPEKLALRDDHPLLRHLGQWKMSSSESAWAVELPVGDAVLPIAWWPPEYAGQPVATVDALVASKTLGRGRIVFCQYPLGPWHSDPRSQLFLDDALDYLMSPVAPAPPVAANR